MSAVPVTPTAVLPYQTCQSDMLGLEAERAHQLRCWGMLESSSCSFPANKYNSSLGKGTTSKYYYYMWRFGWVFYLIALLSNVVSFFTCLLAPCSRLASGVSGFFVANALFWFTIAASLMTYVPFFSYPTRSWAYLLIFA